MSLWEWGETTKTSWAVYPAFGEVVIELKAGTKLRLDPETAREMAREMIDAAESIDPKRKALP